MNIKRLMQCLPAVCLLLFNCMASQNRKPDPVILISMDGFRWDYMDRTATPNLDWLAEHGVRAEALIPVFPSCTFPNHLSLITGCYPENHGIVANRMWDSEFNEWYAAGAGSQSVRDCKWYEAEPFWITVEKAGLKSAVFHWPAGEAEIKGLRPADYRVYDASVSNESIIEQTLSWLRRPEKERSDFIAIYFNEANYYGHLLGVAGTAMDTVIQGLDDNIGQLLEGLEKLELLNQVNIVIVADHGMVDLSDNKVIFLDDYIAMEQVTQYGKGPFAMLTPVSGMLDSVYTALHHAHPHLKVYKKEDMPERFHYSRHRRICPLVCVPDESWFVTTHQDFDEHQFGGIRATHGYDPAVSSMQAIFLASGPAFKKKITVPKFEAVHVYDLMAEIMGIQGAETDGDLNAVRGMLAD